MEDRLLLLTLALEGAVDSADEREIDALLSTRQALLDGFSGHLSREAAAKIAEIEARLIMRMRREQRTIAASLSEVRSKKKAGTAYGARGTLKRRNDISLSA